jgi:LytS/YehU family sensor histidine kinase
MPVVVGATYFFNYYLIPRFLISGRYGYFILYSFYTILTALFLSMLVALLTFLIMAELRVQNMSPASVDISFLLAALLMVVFFGVAIKMLLHWRESKEEYEKLKRDKVEAELKFLKIQLNPHFLFNTLNNLYYLATEKSEKAPLAILQLSEILDYVMHSGKSVFVPLEEELKQVENYIALELLRYEDRVNITRKFSGELNKYDVGPMILITLIENAFKHGVMPIVGKAWINFIVEETVSGLSISISNSASGTKAGNGIGLKNLRSQLHHLYKNEYQLNVDNSKTNEFSINLMVNHMK